MAGSYRPLFLCIAWMVAVARAGATDEDPPAAPMPDLAPQSADQIPVRPPDRGPSSWAQPDKDVTRRRARTESRTWSGIGTKCSPFPVSVASAIPIASLPIS